MLPVAAVALSYTVPTIAALGFKNNDLKRPIILIKAPVYLFLKVQGYSFTVK